MRKVLISFILGMLFFSNTNAQEDTKKDDFNKWQVRFRAISVVPNESATIETIRGDVDISTVVVPELDFTYFFTKNWSVELILATTKHDVNTVSSDLSAIALPSDLDVDLGSVWLLPPTLTLQYHFATEGFRPYLGAGLNYTIFYGVDEGDTVKGVDYDNSVSFAFQAGFDYDLNDKWFLNLDAKYLTLGTDVTVDASNLAAGLSIPANVDINPLVIGFGIGMRF